MDTSRFDHLARTLARIRSRRRVVRTAAGVVTGGAFGRMMTPERAQATQTETFACPDSATDQGTFSQSATCAQTFTPTTSGRLSEVRIKIGNGNGVTPSGDYIVKIVPVDENGLPNLSHVLAKKMIPFKSLGPGDLLLTAKFKKRKAAKIQAGNGKQYAAVVNRPNGDLITVWVRSNDACPGGMFFTRNDQTGEWQQATGFDAVFTALVGY